jgi:restriction system protein
VVYPPTWRERKIYVGRITGDYEYVRRQEQGYGDLRRVQWLKSFPRDTFTPEARRGISVNLAFFQVRNETFLTELASNLK